MKPQIRKNKTIKNKNTTKNNINTNLTKVPVKYYFNNFKNTHLLPKTNIMYYLLNNFNDYLNQVNLANSLGTIPLTLDDCFLIDNRDFPIGLRKDEINVNLKMNPKTSLDKLISYCFYIKQPDFFKNVPQEKTIELIKYQMGKDISRDNRTINGKEYNRSYYSNNASNNYSVADLFYQNIIDSIYSVNKTINLNIVNKFALLSCQNMYNLITDLVTIKLNDILSPETNTVFRPDKHINIQININNFTMDLHFKSQLIISKNGELDPEYPCGNLAFILSIDLRKNTYEFTEFILNYDMDKCGYIDETLNTGITQGVSSLSTNSIMKNGKEFMEKYNIKPQYAIPAVALTAGLISTPFILAALGGKKTRNHNKTNKNKKRNKTNKNKKRNKTNKNKKRNKTNKNKKCKI